MANDLKTRLVIEAQAQGTENIERLAQEVEQMADAGGEAAPKFQLLAGELRGLAQQQGLIERFKALKAETAGFARAAGEAQQATRTAALAMKDKQAALAGAVAAEKALAAQLAAARQQQVQMGQAMQAARQEIKALGQASRQAGADTAVLKDRMQDARRQLGVMQAGWREAGAQVKALAASQREAAQAVRAAEGAAGQAQKAFEAQRRTTAQIGRDYKSSQQALQRLRDEMAGAGLSARDLGQAQARVGRDLAQARTRAAELGNAYRQLGGAAQAAGQAQERTHRRIGDGVQSISQQLGTLRNAYLGVQGALAFGSSVKGLVETADAVSNLQARMKLVTGEGAAFDDMWRRTAELAQRTNSELGATGDLFTRIAAVGKDAGLGVQQAAEQSLALTEAVNQAVQLSGASAAASQAAVTQLIQGLQSGVLRGDEFNSVMEQAPRLARAMADGLGVTTGQLRAMSQEGKLTAEVVIEALQSQADVLGQEFAQLPQTVGRAVQNLSTAWSLFVNQANQSLGASGGLASAINLLADNLETVAAWALRAGAAVAGVYAVRAVRGARDLAAAALGSAGALDAVAASGQRASASMAAATAAKQRFASVARGIGYMAIAEQLLSIGMAYAGIREQQKLYEQASARVAEKDAQIVQRLRAISEATGVTVRSMEELNEAQRTGALVFDEAAGKWVSAAQAQALLAQAAQATAEQMASMQAVQVVEAFQAMAEGGDKARASIEALAASLQLGSADGAAGFVRGLEALRNAGALTAQQFADAWEQALRRLDTGQLEQLRASLEAAGAQGVLSATQLAEVNERVLRNSFERLGVSAAQAMGRVSEGAQQAVQAFDLVARQAQAAGLSAEQAAQAMEMAFAAAVPKAESLADIEQLQTRLDAVAASGRVGAEGLDRMRAALDAQTAAIRQQLPGLQGLEEALRRLGVTPQAELKRLAQAAREAYDTVRSSGQATAREMAEAWRAMAQAQIDANGGAADAALKAQAAQHGMVVATDAAGQSVVRSMQEAAQATRQVGEAALQAGRDAGQGAQIAVHLATQGAAQAAEQTRQAHENMAQAVQFSWLSASAQASKYADEAARHADALEGKWQSANGRMIMGWGQYIDAWNTHFKTLRALADEYAASMERIDAAQARLNQQNSGAARGVDDLRLRLLELNGSEEQVAQARAQRERDAVQRQIEITRLEAERAALRKDTAALERLNEEIALYEQQLGLLGQIAAAERRQRQQKAREGNGGNGGSSGSGGGNGGGDGRSSGMAAAPVINLTANGVNDPARLARLIEPELRRLARLAR